MNPAGLSVAILAGGLATRLHPLTEDIPKSLIDIGGEPFIAHQLRLLRRNRLQQVVVCVGYLGEMIEKMIGAGDRFDLTVNYSFDGEFLLGTAGAVKKALPLLSDPFFVLYGDSYLECDYQTIGKTFFQSGKSGMMTIFHNANRWGDSNVEFSEGRIVAYNKQTKSRAMRHVDYGLGIFFKSAFLSIPEHTASDLEVLYNHLIQSDQLAAYEVSERFYEIGSPEGLDETRSHLLEGHASSSA